MVKNVVISIELCDNPTIIITGHVDAIMIFCFQTHAGYSTTVGGGSGPILVSQLQCAGNEDRLVDCPGPQFTLTSSLCTHVLDAGVVCNICE